MKNEILSKKDLAIKFGIQNDHIVKMFKSKLGKKRKNGCIYFNNFAWDSRDRYRGFNINPTKKYGGIGEFSKVMVKAHRFAFALHYGFDALPKSHGIFDDKLPVINHICNHARCVNPEHLEVLTVSENSKRDAHRAQDSRKKNQKKRLKQQKLQWLNEYNKKTNTKKKKNKKK